MHRWNKILLLFLGLVLGFPAFAQKGSDKLKQKQRELEKKIEGTKNLLGETRNNQRLTIAELAIINQQIALRDELIGNISSQVRRLNQQIQENKSLIEAMTADLVRLKKQYADMVFYAYKHRDTYHKLMFIFASKDFNQAYLRAKYLQQYKDYRKKQVEIIQFTQTTLTRKNEQLVEKRREKEGLAKSQEEEKVKFSQDKEKQQVMLTQLQREEKRLKSVLDDQEKARRQLAAQIKKAIEEEIRKQREAEMAKANKGGKKPPATSASNKTGFVETPETKLESSKFENNKGKLPWPVEKGTITQYFGRNPHPTLPGVVTNNNGIDIGTPKGAKVRAVFEGTISSIFVIPGAGKAVMISHGAYRTVYANLGDVFVSKGQKVATKDFIGIVIEGDGVSEAHFEIWRITEQDFVKQDPSLWIYKN